MPDSTLVYDDDATLELLCGPAVLRRLRRAGLEVAIQVRPHAAAPGAPSAPLDPRAAFEAVLARSREIQDDRLASNRLAATGQIGAGIVHEVRNVMTGILGFAQVAQAKDDRARVNEFLALIERESQRCLDILSRYLEFARGRRRPPAPVDMADVVQGVAKLVQHQLSLSQVKLQLELAASVPPVLGDAGALTQVLLNLILNAMQALAGPGLIRVGLGTEGDGTVVLVVADNGPGIAADIKERLAEPFVTSKPPGQGTGLGLTVSLAIVREHHGTLAVDSEPGQGATFTIRLPVPASRGG